MLCPLHVGYGCSVGALMGLLAVNRFTSAEFYSRHPGMELIIKSEMYVEYQP